ncbi:flagellar biosynthesis regulator FlaF [Tabrizicola sp.]|uniref:flagellar biosynthesis regulator FlaF n=1 Tax=Tabrizicola sp. TaxID=2005166 RepID=UPI003F32DAA2
MTFRSSLAYAQRETPARSFRAVEYDLLARATHRLTAAWARRTTDFPALAAALHQNQQLWSTLAADVADQGNGLPAALRARLFYLYEFTAKHSGAILQGHGSVEVLTDINTAVMRGLRGEGGTP